MTPQEFNGGVTIVISNYINQIVLKDEIKDYSKFVHSSNYVVDKGYFQFKGKKYLDYFKPDSTDSIEVAKCHRISCTDMDFLKALAEKHDAIEREYKKWSVRMYALAQISPRDFAVFLSYLPNRMLPAIFKVVNFSTTTLARVPETPLEIKKHTAYKALQALLLAETIKGK